MGEAVSGRVSSAAVLVQRWMLSDDFVRPYAGVLGSLWYGGSRLGGLLLAYCDAEWMRQAVVLVVCLVYAGCLFLLIYGIAQQVEP